MPPKTADRAKLMVSIVSPSDAPKLAEALSEETRCLHYTFLGKGTAKSNIMDYFGLETEKNVIVSVIPESTEKKLLAVAENALKLYMVGKGIAFTVPLTAASTLIANAVIAGAQPKGVRNMSDEKTSQYDLVAAVYKQEFSDAVLDAAKKAGAVGGTLVHARTLSSEGVEQFAGISLSRETEILLVLTRREVRNDIMRAVQAVAGLKTEGGGVVLSVPVDGLVGLGTSGDEFRNKEDGE